MRWMLILLIAASSLGLAGCPNKIPKAGQGPEVVKPQEESATSGVGEGRVGDARDLPGAGTTATAAGGPAGVGAVIYFDFDSSEIRPEFASVVSAHARHLASFNTARVRLEGHTDERGSREYNIALGERRAQAVRRAMMLQGASDGQLTTVSYGEERPAAEGADEAAYEKNRRVEISYGR